MSSTDPRSRGAHPVEPEQKKKPWWLLLLLAAVAIIVLLLVLSQCGGDDDEAGDAAGTGTTGSATASPSTAGTDSASAAPSPSTSPSPTAAGTAPAAPAAPGNGSGTLTVGTTTLLPMSGATPAGDMASLTGQPATATQVPVLSVPADEGFWVGTSENDRVWVQLTGSGESPYQVKEGDLVDFTGTTVTHQPGFAAKVGVSDADGAAQLDEQGAHIEAPRSAVKPSAG